MTLQQPRPLRAPKHGLSTAVFLIFAVVPGWAVADMWGVDLIRYDSRAKAEGLVRNLARKNITASVVTLPNGNYLVRVDHLDDEARAMQQRRDILMRTNLKEKHVTVVQLTSAKYTRPAEENKVAVALPPTTAPTSLSKPVPSPTQPEPLIANVTLNTMAVGEFFMMRDGDDLLLDRDTLNRIGLTRGLPAGDWQRLSFKSLAPKLRFKLDESNGSVNIEADPAMLSGHSETLQLRQPSSATLLSGNALYLNYNLNYNKSSSAADNYSVPLELAANWNGLSLINNFNWQTGRQMTRTQSQLVYDDTNDLRRWTVGDISGTSGNRLGTSMLGGVRMFKHYGMAPSIFTGPPLAMKAMLLNPSEVEVYVDGNMVFKGKFPAGELDLRNIPYYRAGLGESKIVVRDAFGRESIVNDTFYSSTNLLAPGLHSYDYAFGVARSQDALGVLNYASKPMIFGSHRYGYTDWLTPGLGFESDGHDLRGGVTADMLLGDLGQLGLVAAASRRQGLSGEQIQIDYSYASTKLLSPGLFFTRQSANYGGLFDPLTQSPSSNRWRGGASLAVGLGYASLTGRWTRSQHFDGNRAQEATLAMSTLLPGGISLSTQFTRSWQQSTAPENRLHASLGHSFSNGLYLSANFSRDNNGNTFGIQLQLSPPLGNGYGYSAGITAPPQGDTTSTARLQYHHTHGEFQLGRSGSGNAPTYDASMSGAVLLAGGEAYLTRPIRDSYAVVRVPGMERVKVRVQNQQVGETNADGTLALPHLHAHMDNTLSIDTAEIPFNYAVDANSKVVTTGYRGGGVVNFGVKKMQIIGGKAFYRRDDKLESAQYSGMELNGNGTSQRTVIGFGGEIYVEGVAAGSYQARFFNERQDCHFTLVVPESNNFINNLGDVVCNLSAGAPKENP